MIVTERGFLYDQGRESRKISGEKQTGAAGADRMRGIFADGDVSGREICKRGVTGSFDL